MPDVQLRTLVHDSAVMGRRGKRIFALVPSGAAQRAMPLCYYLHGWGGTGESFLNHARILETLRGSEQVAVFPESFRNWFINDHEGNRYEDYLIREVIPAAERAWLPHGCDGRRRIAGFSMGGLSALCMGWRYPELFAGVACFAGAFEAPRRVGDPYAEYRARADLLIPSERDITRAWGEPGSSVRDEYDPYLSLEPDNLRRTRIYLSIGTGDFARMLDMNRRMHSHLLGADVEHKYEEYAALGHDMELVASSLQSSLEHLSVEGAS